MTSSMITGDQRWPASKRRSGMTVLGKVPKVAAPKPLNLPSQRLENHGLDPSVEIVPKGTLSWGSKPSTGSNVWATSAPSPSTDGSSSSRPLSGSGTRPSTAGNDKAHESNVNSWVSNSRPSSASGVLASNLASSTSRPHSADTRPGSSHLSRFAEPSPEGSKAWGATAAERMGVSEGFSLSSGDFPTLGSEKDDNRKSSEPIDDKHGRPGSSSGGVKSVPDSMEITHDDARDSDSKGQSWRKDSPSIPEDGPRPSMDRWQEDPHLYQNPNIGPSHYDSWPGPPSVNHPGAVWYNRGPPGPHFGGPVPPGGFHMEPFPYYRPQGPGPVLANSQSIPPPGHHGHHPKSGDVYRQHMPEPFMHPGVPMRPGFFPAPGPYEGYYRPPMGFHNPNDRDFPFMGMPGGPPIYNRPTNPNTPDLNNSHPRSFEGRRPDKGDPGLLHDPRGNHNVLVKPNDGWNQNGEEKWGHRMTGDGSNHEKGILSKVPLQDNAWGDDHKTSKGNVYGGSAARNEVPSRPIDNRFHSNSPALSKLSASVNNKEEPGTGPSTNDHAPSKDRSLIQKIEGLNAKARASGGSQSVSNREELPEKVAVGDAWAHQSVDDAKPDVVLERHFPTRVLVPVSRDINVASEKSGDSSMTSGPRRSIHGAQNRGDRQGKAIFDGQEASGWGRKTQSQSQSVRSAGSNLTASSHVRDHNSPVQPFEVRKANMETKGVGESALADFDHNDNQRAKMREIAKQRAIQLQKEEEERIREQKAKALAKLEELNRRSATQRVEVPSREEIVPPHPSGPPKSDDSKYQPDLKATPNVDSSAALPVKIDQPDLKATPNVDSSAALPVKIDQPDLKATLNVDSSAALPVKIDQISNNGPSQTVDSAATSTYSGAESKGIAQQDSASSQIQLKTDTVYVEDAAANTTSPQGRDTLKNKRAGYEARENVVPKKIFSQTSIVFGQIDVLIDTKIESTNKTIIVGNKADGEDRKELSETPLFSHPPATHKRRNNKSGKNKHKAEESSKAISSTVSSVSPEDNASNQRQNSTSVQLSFDAKAPTKSSGENSSVPRDDVLGRLNNLWKHQQSRKPRSSQGNRLSEKAQSSDAVVWAPVRSHNKVATSDFVSQKAAEPVPSPAGENVSQSSSKTKRAEMERYVPKPVSKESIQQSPTPELAPQDSSSGISSTKVGPVVEGKNRQARGQGSWRQRVPQHYSSGSSSTNEQPSVGHTVVSTEPTMIKGPEAGVTDGWNIANDSSSKSSAATGVKDLLPSGRGKSSSFRGQRGGGISRSFDHKDSSAVLTNSHYAEKTLPSKDNGPVVDRSTPHWQPKSRGNRSHGGQNHMAEDNKVLDIGSGSGTHSQPNHSAAKDPRRGPVDEEFHNVGHQEFKGEKRGPYGKGRPHHPNSQGLEAGVERALSDGTDRHFDQRPSSGYRKNSNYGGRVNRAHEPRGDWSTTAPERPRQNSHYEYQPVGPHNNDSGSQFDNLHGGQKFQGRGHPGRGRGNFHGRRSGNE